MGIFSFQYLPTINTSRLTLREMKISDYADMYEYSKLSEVTRYLLWREHPDEAYTKAYLKRVRKHYRDFSYYDWAIIYNGTGYHDPLVKYSGRLVGTCGFSSIDEENHVGELGYVLNPALHGNEVALEAARAVMDFGFNELGLNRIEAKYIIGNTASRRVMDKLGMKYEGTMRSAMLIKGIYRDIGICAILKNEFKF